MGLVEAEVNGRKVGNDALIPGWTDYNNRVECWTYDVTETLEAGANALGFWLGDGWYRGRLGFDGGYANFYGGRIGVFAQLEVEYADGHETRVYSNAWDRKWKVAPGPIICSDMCEGERYDAREEMEGWSMPGFDDSDWKPVAEVPYDPARIPENVRGTFSSFYGGAMIVGQSAGTFLGSKFIDAMGVGFVIGAVLFGITGILTVIVWPAERSSKVGSALDDTRQNVRLSPAAIAKSFIPPTRNCRDFYFALAGRLLLIFGWSMVSGYQLYILKKFCGLGKEAAASTLATMSVISMIVLIVCSIVSGPISDKLHRRKIIVAVGSVIIAVGLAVPYVMPTATGMMLFAGIGGVGYGIYIAVDQALNVDVLPNADEAGKDLGILNLANTVGQVLAPVATGAVVVATGSYALVFPIAIASVLVGAAVIMLIRKVA